MLTWDDPKDSSITHYELRSFRPNNWPGNELYGYVTIAGSNASTTRHEAEIRDGEQQRFQIRAIRGSYPGPGSDVVTAGPADPDVIVSTSSLTVEEGSSSTYTVRPTTVPLGSDGKVVIRVAGASGELSAAPATLTFTSANYIDPQTVTVTLAEDNDAKTDAAQTITHSVQGRGYDQLDVDSVVVTLVENDAPLKPTNFRAINGPSQVTLSWDDPENPDITGWKLAQKTGASGSYSGFTAIPDSSASTTSHTVTGLTDGTVYGFKILAVSAIGDGTESDEVVLTAGNPGLSIADVTAAENGTFTFTVMADSATREDATFSYMVTAESGDTATAGTDFTAVTPAKQLTMAAGETTATITVAVVGDKLDEDNETFTVTLSAPSANIRLADATATGTIMDDDATPTLRIIGTSSERDTDTVVAEGDDGDTAPMEFKVILSATSGREVSIEYGVRPGGSATAGKDYNLADGRLVFPANSSGSAWTQTITGQVLGDNLDEPNEVFTVELKNLVNAEPYKFGGDGGKKDPMVPDLGLLPSDLGGPVSPSDPASINSTLQPSDRFNRIGSGVVLTKNQEAFGRITDDG